MKWKEKGEELDLGERKEGVMLAWQDLLGKGNF